MDDNYTMENFLTKDAEPESKRLSVERIYQKKTQLEHILLRPDTYIGSVEKITQSMWIWDDLQEEFIQREITYVPGLYKIFDEILVNAADNKQRDPTMTCIRIDIDPESNKIKIWNNGKGIPVVEHKVEKVFVPTLIFGTLLTSSNYNDDEKKVTGGRNGYGAKLCNIFSTKFIVETSSKEYKKSFKQEWTNNMGNTTNVKIKDAREEDYTCITFYPDLEKFKMEKLDEDIVALFTRRAYDIAAVGRGLKVYLNGKKLPIKGFKDYVDLFIKGKMDEQMMPLKVVYENVNDRWEVAVTLSDKGFQQVSFVNSIATTKGGRHVDYVADQLITKLIEQVKKKQKKGDSVNIKPFQVRGHVWLFVNALIENPAFDSQTKETLTTTTKHFGSKCALTDNFAQKANKVGIVESILSWMKFKAQEKMNKKCGSTKQSKLKGIPKLDDANDAGTRNSSDCTLILTEGDSAKTLAVAGLAVIGRDRYGVFPLKGKVLNVREAGQKQIMENAEINNIIKILGLRYKEKYDTPESLKTLRYGKVMIMTDQDQDGSHIKGLLLNFIHCNWPGLLRQRFVEQFITPIVKVSKNKHELSFYSLPEFEEWKKETDNWNTWRVKYYKGLGTSTAKEAKEYFSDMDRHRIRFNYTGTEDDSSLLLAFSKKKIEERKEWLTNWMEERKRRAQLDLPEIYLYGKETKAVSYNEFVNRELILFSNMDNERSIPSLVDGFKPGQRKVMFTCFKRNITKDFKVAQLAGSVAEHSAYHHGEQSLMGTIINLAQNYIGSNNINLLVPNGQFGTRLHGGKDSASPRYIFTHLSKLARLLFPQNDDPLLKSNYDDNQKIEPEYYVPIIPMVLVNGAEGIGTGWSTKINNYNPREIVENLIRMLDGEEPTQMHPWYKSFTGSIQGLDEGRYACNGEISVIDDSTLEITELPIKTWTQTYKEGVMEPMLQGSEKVSPTILDYKEYHTDTTVKFIVKMSPDKMAKAEDEGLHKFFKIQSSMSTGSMVLFDSNGCIKRYNNVMEILKEFFDVRKDFYQRRKDYLEGMLAAESLRLDNQARFIMEKVEGKITIENKPKKELIQMLVRRGYDSDPVKTWKEAQNKLAALEDEEDDENSETSSGRDAGPDFNYILSMALWCLTKEKVEEICKNRDNKAEELYQLKKKSPSDLWRADLQVFLKALDEAEEEERQDEMEGTKIQSKTAKGRKTMKKAPVEQTRPSPIGRRVEPKIDMAKKAALAAAAKKSKSKLKLEDSQTTLNDMFNEAMDDDSNEPKSLADRLGGGVTSTLTNGVNKAEKPKKSKDVSSKSKAKPEESDAVRGVFGDAFEKVIDSDDDEFPIPVVEKPEPKKKKTLKDYKQSTITSSFAKQAEDPQQKKRPALTKSKTVQGSSTTSVLSKGKSKGVSLTKSQSVKTKPFGGGDMNEEGDGAKKTKKQLLKKTKSCQNANDMLVSDSGSESEIEKSSQEGDIIDIQSSGDLSRKKRSPSPAEKGLIKKMQLAELKKKAAPKKAAKAPRKRPTFEDSDSDDEFTKKKAKPSKAPAKKSKKAAAVVSSDDEDISFEDLEDLVPRTMTSRNAGGRAKAPVKYNFDDDDDSDFEF